MSQTSSSLRFIVPGLLDPVPYLKELPVQELPALPLFSKCLSRGDYSVPKEKNLTDMSYYQCLLNDPLFINTFEHQEQHAIASLSYFLDIQNLTQKYKKKAIDVYLNEHYANKFFMRADPCFMVADRDQLVLARTTELDLSWPEAQQLCAEINDFYQPIAEEQFWTLKALSAEHWYIISDRPLNIKTTPSERVLGQAVKSYLVGANNDAQKQDSQHWRALFNEFQMILHQSNTNQQRLKNKQYPINSLWFWGQGAGLNYFAEQEPSSIGQKSAMVYTKDAIAQSLSLINHYQYSDVPEVYQHDPSGVSTQTLYILDDFAQAIQNKDIISWLALVEKFEKNYLQTILKNIKEGHLSQVEFVSPTGAKLLINKRLLRRWWRNKKTAYVFMSDNVD